MKMKYLALSIMFFLLLVPTLALADESLNVSATVLTEITFIALTVTLGAFVISAGILLTVIKVFYATDIDFEKMIGILIFLLIAVTMIGVFVLTLL
jgi:hypothetical protein